jgi:hypothetical protein
VSQALAYNVVVVALVWRGYGDGELRRGAPRPRRDRRGAGDAREPVVGRLALGLAARAAAFLRIGLPLQGSALVGQLKDSITPIFIGLAAGARPSATCSGRRRSRPGRSGRRWC